MAEGGSFQLVAGHVALDFANTLDNRYDPERVKDLLAGYEDFVRFARQSVVIDDAQASRLRSLPTREKQGALRTLRTVRELIERMFTAAVEGKTADPEDLAQFNAQLQKALQHRTLVEERGAIHWEWSRLDRAALGPLWPIALAAAELLTSADLTKVRECSAETCRWLFLDLSKNHTRRWCDMKICGNRIKARRYYQSHS